MTDPPLLGRREVLRSAAAGGTLLVCGAGLCACGGSGSSAASPGATTATVAAAEVPVGGGVILPDLGGIVVTQPTQGVFKAFSSACPHQGCKVGSVGAGSISCPCHGSQFAVADGSVTHGPALRGLIAMTAQVQGSNVVVS